jgi:hypothetical protein
MVFAQEIIGRPFITILGIKATTIVWVLLAIFLGIIFSMVMWPSAWRAMYKRIKDEEEKKNEKNKKII